MVSFTIYLIPKGQMRARHGTGRGGKYVHTYKHPKQRAEEQSLEVLLALYRPKTPMTGALLMGFKAFLPIPMGKPKKWRESASVGHIRPTGKPDLDNLAKHIKDCMTNTGFWEDDRQVVGYLPGTGKYYSANPRWEVEVWQLQA